MAISPAFGPAATAMPGKPAYDATTIRTHRAITRARTIQLRRRAASVVSRTGRSASTGGMRLAARACFQPPISAVRMQSALAPRYAHGACDTDGTAISRSAASAMPYIGNVSAARMSPTIAHAIVTKTSSTITTLTTCPGVAPASARRANAPRREAMTSAVKAPITAAPTMAPKRMLTPPRKANWPRLVSVMTPAAYPWMPVAI